MAGTMSQADLIADLKGILMDAAKKFTAAGDADFSRHLAIAALDLGRIRPRTMVGQIDLAADVGVYDAPPDLVAVKFPLWGTAEKRERRPWEGIWPGALPRLRVIEQDGAKALSIEPPPNLGMITDLGSTYRFYYYAGHVIGASSEETSVQASDRHLLLIRAAAQALLELANNGVTKPVQLGSAGVGAMPKNGTPGALAQALLDHFEAMAA